MSKIDIKRAVKEKVDFTHYFDGDLYYETKYGEVFTVPISDLGVATAGRTEKGILLMRYMRKWNEQLEEQV